MPDIKTPWKDPHDLLDRQKYAEFLTNYLASKENSFVLNLNAKWGTGKTFFLAHWRKSIEKKHPSVYVNAWESDFSEDPLLAVMSAIHDQLQDHLPKKQKTIEEFSEKFKSGARFLRDLAPIITKGLVHKTLGSEAGGEAIKALSLSEDDMADIAAKSMSILLEEHAGKLESITDFKKSLTTLIHNVVKGGDLVAPLFLFIDELDRCRPTYAIELLETVKHLFSTDGVVFVIATDSGQLQHSIRAIYGNDFDGSEYLRRFFDQEYVLPEPDYAAYCKSLTERFPCVDAMEYASFQPWNINGDKAPIPDGWGKKDSMMAFLSLFSKHYELSLRSINQVVVRLEAILENSDEEWDGPYLLLLLVLQAKYKWIISWLRERCTKGDLSSVHDELTKNLIQGGDTIRWYCNSVIGEKAKDIHFTTEELAIAYIDATEKVQQAPPQKMHDLLRGWETLKNYASSKMAEKKMEPQTKLSDMTKYFDHVEMAGALS